MLLTKSLFVEFTQSPKLAWWHLHDKKTYEAIQEAEYGEMDGVAIGQSVEDLVKQLYPEQTISYIDTTKMRSNRHGTYHQRTIQAIEQATGVIYQPAFLVGDLFVKCDFLVPDGQGRYDLVEVKAKNKIRKETKEQPLLPDLQADVSIQAYVLRRALGEKFSGKVSIAYLNKEYVKNGPIDPQQLILQDDVSSELLEEPMIEIVLDAMRDALPLEQAAFEQRYPYDGSDYLTYFGKPQPKASIWTLGGRLSADKKRELYEAGKTELSTLSSLDIDYLKNTKGEETTAYSFATLWQQGEEVIDTAAIYQELANLTFPLYFYDYETISSPIPVFDGTHPRQQVVVQYSLHKVQSDGTIQHFQGLLEPESSSTEGLIKQMLTDMDNATAGTWIVRYKGFENYRNNEMGAMFPHFADQLTYINEHTFDLMEVFSKQLYFDRRFEGSASIKKVLPVLTDISYNGLAVPNGAVAAELLMKVITGKLDFIELAQAQTDLLTYCKQDTRAMVAIWQKLLEKVR